MTDVSATPHRFHVQLRLVSNRTVEAQIDALGGGTAEKVPNPFANRDYRLVWGGQTFPGKTDADGFLHEFVAGPDRDGRLNLGEIVKGAFVTQMSIIVAVRDPKPIDDTAPAEQLVEEIGYRLLNLGFITERSSATVREGIRNFLFRRQTCGTKSERARASATLPDWQLIADILADRKKLGLLAWEIHSLHDTDRVR